MVWLISKFHLIIPNNILDGKVVFFENLILLTNQLTEPPLVQQKVRKAYYTHYTIDDRNFLSTSL